MTCDQINEELQQIQKFASDRPDPRDGPEVVAFLSALGSYVMRTAELVAITKGMLAEAQGLAAKELKVGKGEEYEFYGAKQISQIIDGLCAKYIEAHTRAERTNAALTHAGEWTRSILSANKAEAQATGWQDSVREDKPLAARRGRAYTHPITGEPI